MTAPTDEGRRRAASRPSRGLLAVAAVVVLGIGLVGLALLRPGSTEGPVSWSEFSAQVVVFNTTAGNDSKAAADAARAGDYAAASAASGRMQADADAQVAWLTSHDPQDCYRTLHALALSLARDTSAGAELWKQGFGGSLNTDLISQGTALVQRATATSDQLSSAVSSMPVAQIAACD